MQNMSLLRGYGQSPRFETPIEGVDHGYIE
jgi:hypothetical protein